MGLLDELRREADSRKTDAQRKHEQQARALEDFRTSISPKLLLTYRYLQELAEHLNVLNPEVKGLYLFPTTSQAIPLRQGNYQVRSDTQHATQETHKTSLLFDCTRMADIIFSVDKEHEITRCERTLYDRGLEFHCRKTKNDRFEVVGGEFIVKPKVSVAIHFSADIPNTTIHLYISNFEGLGVRQMAIKPDKLNESFLDDFGNYLLRRKSDFMKLDISDEARERLREQIAEARRREAELIEIDAKRNEPEQRNSETLLTNLFKRT